MERRDRALKEWTPPTGAHRIRFVDGENVWVVEVAKPYVSGYFSQEERLYDEDDYWMVGGIGYPPLYPVEAFDGNEPKVEISWRQIGPLVARVERNLWKPSESYATQGPAAFSTYDEAAEWLRAFLKPVEKITYFNADAEPVSEPAP